MVDNIGVLGGSDCELLRSGWLAQPANAVSAFAFLVAGARLAGMIGRPGVHRAALAAGAAALAAVGVGSIAYHGPQPGWAAPAHDGSIGVLIVVDAVLFGAAMVQGRVTGAARASWRQAAGWMAVALGAFVAGRTGGWLCDPASLLQPHALWHVFSAVGLGQLALGCARLAPGSAPVARPSG
jgi:hypothetical protein